MKKITLDTFGFSALLRGKANVLLVLEEADVVYVPVFVLAEMYTGIRNEQNNEENLFLINNFLKKNTVQVISPTIETAQIFSELKVQMTRDKPFLSVHDIWIAALNMEHGARLLTLDKNFMKIPGLLMFQEFVT
jgi:tRNA(fMet)-specific endonuclease VapC